MRFQFHSCSRGISYTYNTYPEVILLKIILSVKFSHDYRELYAFNYRETHAVGPIYLICLITFEYYVNGSFGRTLLAYLFRNVYNDNLENLTAGVAQSRNVRILKFSHGNVNPFHSCKEFAEVSFYQ